MPRNALYTRLSADPNASAKLFLRTFPGGYRLHMHSFYEIEFVIGGSAIHVLNGTPHTIKKGDVIFITPTAIHEFLPMKGQPPLEMYTLSFSYDVIAPEVWQSIATKREAFSLRLEEKDFAVFQHILESFMPYAGAETLRIIPFTTIGLEWLILNLFKNVPPDKEINNVISPAIAFMQSNFTSPITLKDAADVVYLSPPYFSSLFHESVGVSFQTYLLNTRLDFAANLLGLTDLSIGKVCEEAGFRTLAYFSRAYKKRFGYSPEKAKEMSGTAKEN